MVIRGERPKKSHLCNQHVTFHNLQDPEEVYTQVIKLYNTLPKDSCQVLFPTRKETTVGTIQFNKLVAQQKHQTTNIASGDKIVCIKNNIVTNEEGEVIYQQSTFNGELGEVVLTDDKRVMIKTLTDKEITLTPDTIEHAWAISVNKSQGSEYDHVILVLHDSQTIMLTRELLYTAITRAKKHLYIIASASALFRAVDNRIKPRHSFLSSLFA